MNEGSNGKMKEMKKDKPKSKKHECFRVVIMCEMFLGENWQSLLKKEEEVKKLVNECEKIDAEVEAILKEYFENNNNVGEDNLKLKCVMKKVLTEKIERREEINKTVAKLRRVMSYLNQQIKVNLRKHEMYSKSLQSLK